MILADTHCHLMHELYKGKVDSVIERAKKAGVKAIICSGVNVPTNREALALAEKYDIVKCSFGIYPVDALNIKPDATGLSPQEEKFEVDEELKFVKKNKDKIIAIGEAGLEYHWVKEAELHKKMKENFQKVISAAEKIKLPLVVHSRKGEAECIELLESSKVKDVVMHCFSGKKNLVKKGIDLGFNFSIPTNIAKAQQFQIIAEMAPMSQLLTETDGPWLSPVKGEVNEPANVLLTVKEIAKIKGFTPEEVANSIWVNYQRVFG